MDLQRGDKCVAFLDLSICHTWKNIWKLCGNNKLKILETTWDEECKLPNGSYSVSNNQG